MTICLKLNARELHGPVAHDLCAPGGSPTKAAFSALRAQLHASLREALGSRLVKLSPPPTSARSRGSAATLPALTQSGCEAWYWETAFSTREGDVLQSVDVEAAGVDLLPIDYGRSVSRAWQLKSKPLKTQVNHVLRLNHVRVPGAFFARVQALVEKSGGPEQPLLANFQTAGSPLRDIVSFDHMLNGKRFFCSCAKRYYSVRLAEAIEVQQQYVPGSWPHAARDLLAEAKYVDGLCHICVARVHSNEEAVRRYGSDIQDEFEAYVPQLAFDGNVDTRTARAKVKQILGLSRWVREATLYEVLQELFPTQVVLREASPSWLGRMRLDIYLPAIGLAVEHQGEQHYRPVAAFGGEAGHLKVIARDRDKRELCRQNGVDVVDVRFDAPISVASMRKRLARFVSAKS